MSTGSQQLPNISPEVEHADERVEFLPTIAQKSIFERLGGLALDEGTVLAHHQVEAFNDIVSFFQSGRREAYAKMPTGTGKTVLMVEVCKRLLTAREESACSQRIIILAPTVQLVDQIVGGIDEESGKRRGFKGFEPDIDTRSYHSKNTTNENRGALSDAEVFITTYSSFRNLIDTYIELEKLTTTEVESELQKMLDNVSVADAEAIEQRDKLNKFLRLSFQKQEVFKAKAQASQLLNTEYDLEPEQLEALKEIIGFTISDDNTQDVFKKIKATVFGQVNDDIRSSIQRLIDYYDAIAKTGARRRKDQLALGDASAEQEDESIYANLTPFERFIFKFAYRHGSNRKSKLKPIDLVDRDERKIAEDLADESRHFRAAAQHSQRRSEALVTQLNIRERIIGTDFIICDEAHRSIGTRTWEAIREFAAQRDIALLGLTATDKYLDRSLEDHYEGKAHELTLQEAIRREIVNPVALFVHDTGLRFEGVEINATGDYNGQSIRAMRLNMQRNQQAVDYAKILIEHGYSGLMPAIPGNKGEHAKMLARMLQETNVIDPTTKEIRKIRAAYILKDTPREIRDMLHASLESGEIDWLTSIDVHREGFDSDRAKAIINTRPTRSPLLAIQRLGRIGRIGDRKKVSICIDFYDGMSSSDGGDEMPPVLGVDIYELDNVQQGYIVGEVNEHDTSVISTIRERAKEPIKAHFTRYRERIRAANIINNSGVLMGNVEGVQHGEWRTYQSLLDFFKGYFPEQIIKDALSDKDAVLRTSAGRKRATLVPVFAMNDVVKLHQDKPEVNPQKIYIDKEGVQWMTPEGCTILLSKKLPHLNKDTIEDLIRRFELDSNTHLDRAICRVRLTYSKEDRDSKFGLSYMYRYTDILEKVVPYIVEVSV